MFKQMEQLRSRGAVYLTVQPLCGPAENHSWFFLDISDVLIFILFNYLLQCVSHLSVLLIIKRINISVASHY